MDINEVKRKSIIKIKEFIATSEIQEIIYINKINLLMFFICFIGSFTGSLKYFIYVIACGFYIYYLIKKDERVIILHQLYFLILSEFMLDSIFHYIRIETPLELKYISEIISLVIILKIIMKRKDYENILKNKVLMLVFFIIVINIIITIVNKQDLAQLLNAIRIYFRFIPVYIVISYKGILLNKIYGILYVANLIIFLLLTLLGTHRDLRNGIFGIVGSHTFAIFVSIILIYKIVNIMNNRFNKYNTMEVLFYGFGTIIMFVISENKAFMGLIGISIFLIVIINKGNLVKKIIICMCIILMSGVGANILVKMYPQWTYLLSIKNFQHNIDDYIFGNSNKKAYSMGRYEAMNYISNLEFKTLNKKLLGLGLGSSIPRENSFYINDSKEQFVFDFPESRIYKKYDKKYGYYLSSLSYIYLDNGILGTLVLISLVLISFLKGVYILRNGKTVEKKFIGGVAIFIVLSAIYSCGYGGALINRTYNYINCIILGLLTYSYDEYKKESEVNG